MKYLYLILSLTFISSAAKAQQAYDWTRNDCDGNSHHLFSELDKGDVVIIEFVMMDCMPCVTASKGLKNMATPYDSSHPGRVHIYAVAYHNSITCEQLSDWKTESGADYPAFTGGAEELANYGSMGMPTIVILGGSSHYVYYKREGFMPSQAPVIKAAINQALTGDVPAGIAETTVTNSINLYPNPVKDRVTIGLKGNQADRIIIRDILGREVVSLPAKGMALESFDISSLGKGYYIIAVQRGVSVIAFSSFIKE